MNSTKSVVGGKNGDKNGDRNGKGKLKWAERDREWGKGGDVGSRSGSRERRKKNCMLVGDVQDYWGFYVGAAANKVWYL